MRAVRFGVSRSSPIRQAGKYSLKCLPRTHHWSSCSQFKGIVHPEQLNNHSTLDEEVHALWQLKHPNNVTHEEATRLLTCSYLVMEYCHEGDLRCVLDAAIDFA